MTREGLGCGRTPRYSAVSVVPDPSDLVLNVQSILTATRVGRCPNYIILARLVNITLVINRHIFLPLRILVITVEGNPVARCAWGGRLPEEPHPGSLRRTPRFSLVARLACTSHVLPHVFAAEVSRNDMVYGEFPGLPAAVLARVAISNEYLAATQLPGHTRAPDEVDKTNDGRAVYRERGAMDDAVVIFQNLGFASPKKNDRTPRPTNVERFVVLVEYQHRRIDHDKAPCIGHSSRKP